MLLITASADQSVKLWNVQTGAQLYTFSFNSPARSVDFSVGDKLAVITTDPFMGVTSAINVKSIADDPSQRKLVHVMGLMEHIAFHYVVDLMFYFFLFFLESGE